MRSDPLKVYYASAYTVPLPDGHRFPMRKYRMLRDALLSSGVLDADHLTEPTFPDKADILRAHDAGFVDAFLGGTLDPRMIRKIGFPWSQGLVDRILATVGGAIGAAEHALAFGIAGNLAGGTHHATRAGGEGFCVFNDLAIVALRLLQTGRCQRVAILDLDVHQGNGNSEILAGVPGVFIASVHGERNYPFVKVVSTIDIGLPDKTNDAQYLRVVEELLPHVVRFNPDIVLYQAGVDGLASDRLGHLSLTHAGLIQRDELVLGELRSRNIPVSLALGGGYAEPIIDTVNAHVGTYRVVRSTYG